MKAHPFLIFWLAKFVIRAGTISAVLVAAYWLVGKMSDGAKTFWISVFSDGGCGSFSRVGSGLIIIACLAWDSFFVYVKHDLPDSNALWAQALLIGVPYGLNVSGNAIRSVAGKEPAAPDCPPIVAKP